MERSSWRSNNTLLRYKEERGPVNTIVKKTIFENDFFVFYLINGKKLDTNGSGMSYNNEYKVDSKGLAKDQGVEISIGETSFERKVEIYVAPDDPYKSTSYGRTIKSPDKFIEVVKEADDFSKKVKDYLENQYKTKLSRARRNSMVW